MGSLTVGRLPFEFISGTYEALLPVSLRYTLFYSINNLVVSARTRHCIGPTEDTPEPLDCRTKPSKLAAAFEARRGRSRRARERRVLFRTIKASGVPARRSGPARGIEGRRMPSHDVDRISRVQKCNPNVVHLYESAMFSYTK